MLDLAKYNIMLSNYYEKRGWDERGVPTKATLDQLGLVEEAKQLHRYVRLRRVAAWLIRPCKIHHFFSFLPTVNARCSWLFYLEWSNPDGRSCFFFNFRFIIRAAAPCRLNKTTLVTKDCFKLIVGLHCGGFFLKYGFGSCKQIILNFRKKLFGGGWYICFLNWRFLSRVTSYHDYLSLFEVSWANLDRTGTPLSSHWLNFQPGVYSPSVI